MEEVNNNYSILCDITKNAFDEDYRHFSIKVFKFDNIIPKFIDSHSGSYKINDKTPLNDLIKSFEKKYNTKATYTGENTIIINPLNIYDDDNNLRLSDRRGYFVREIAKIYEYQVHNYNKPTLDDAITMIENYVIFEIIDYKNSNNNRIPSSIVKDIVMQVKEMINKLFPIMGESNEVSNRIEKRVNEKKYRPDIENFIKLYFSYFTNIYGERNKKNERISKVLIEMLLENYDNDGAYVAENYLITNVKEQYKFIPLKQELKESVFFINTIYGSESRFIENKSTFQMGRFTEMYKSLFRKYELEDIFKNLNKIV